ncbi:MAG: hypothetical protein JWM64_2750, partial [Frankiales bacterium]|nr:hypothetical protein [Frankiales bacterium]
LPAARATALLAATDAADAAAARALGVRSPSVYLLVEAAHLSTAPLARELAVALDSARGLSGSATSPTAELRARMVTQSVAHPFQTGLASDAALTYGLGSAQYAGAKKALDANTAALTRLVTELTYPANGASFARQWNRHIGDYATFVRGLQTGSAGLRTAAATDLGDFVRDNAVQLSRVSGLPAAALVPQLKVHAAGTLDVIRLQAARSPEQFPAAAMGTNHFAQVGDLLAASAAKRLGLAD